MKVILIGGYPGSGKSTIVKRLIKCMTDNEFHFTNSKYGKMVKYLGGVNTFFLGSYAPDEVFPGTDRLPMNVQPEVEEFLVWNAKRCPECVVIAEGDRLFNTKMINFINSRNELQLVLCIVEARMELISSRRIARSEQNESWRKGRQTKVDGIRTLHQLDHLLKNNTEAEQSASVKELYDEVLGKWNGGRIGKSIKDLWS